MVYTLRGWTLFLWCIQSGLFSLKGHLGSRAVIILYGNMSLKAQLEVMKMSCDKDTRQFIALYLYSLDGRGE